MRESRGRRQQRSLTQEALQSWEVSTPLTGTANSAIPREGALTVVENIHITTGVTERVNQAAAVMTKPAEMGERVTPKESSRPAQPR